jgi:glycosyltransferase involved in cell wall biosynthesis
MASNLPVEFMGGFSPLHVAEIYDDIDVLVVPSLWPENSPLVIHEAFQAGVAVVGASSGGIPGLVVDGTSGLLFEPGSAADLARALKTLIDDPARIADLAAGAPAVKSVATDAAEWDRTYRDLLGRYRSAV